MRAPSLTILTLLLAAGPGCKAATDEDVFTRPQWVHQQTADHNVYLREFLNGTPDMQFFEGWYAVESDMNTGAAWRWTSKRAIVRLRTVLYPAKEAQDMKLTVYGWVPGRVDIGYRTSHMDFSVNGHVLERFEPPKESFVHDIFVPKFLLEKSEWVDFVIAVANTAKPRGDWRDLGMATTGFIWRPAAEPPAPASPPPNETN